MFHEQPKPKDEGAGGADEAFDHGQPCVQDRQADEGINGLAPDAGPCLSGVGVDAAWFALVQKTQ